MKKKGNKKAKKLFDNEGEAIAYAELLEREGKDKYEIEHRPGEDTKCLKYCSVCDFCSHGKALKNA